jgi:hypothetical protein
MKRLLIIFLVFIPLIGMPHENKPIDKLYRKYTHKKGVTTLNLGYIPLKISGFVCRLAGSSEEAKLIKGVKGIRILSVEDKSLNKSINFYKELEADGFFKNNNYEVLMEVTEKDEVVRFFGKSLGNEKLSELLLVVGGNYNTLISISGVIDPKDIGKITGTLNLNLYLKSL